MSHKLETTRMLRILYTDPQRLELGKQLSDKLAELRGIESDLSRVKAAFKSKSESAAAVIEDLSQKVATGYHIADVKCRWVMGEPTSIKKTLLRMDTGDIVEVTEMTQADLQKELELTSPGTTPPEESETEDDEKEAAAT